MDIHTQRPPGLVGFLRWPITLLFLGLWVWGQPALAMEIQVLGLFNGKAMVEINGQRRVLAEGERSPEGVLLIEANSKQAMLEVDGEARPYALGRRVGTQYVKPGTGPTVNVYRNSGGMFTTVGTINGFSVQFLVDTGASSVAMNTAQAKRLGIDYRLYGRRVGVSTASGTASGYEVRLDSVKVGDIELHNVEAIVLEGGSPEIALLGMSFLGRLSIQNDGHVMQLEKKY